jgi:lipoteichoic acid synthase
VKKSNFWQTRFGFFAILVLTFAAKDLFAAYCDFNLGLSDPYQHFIIWLSPFGLAAAIISLGLYVPRPLLSYISMLVLDLANTVLLFANIVYYRQFNDFLTIKTIQNTSKVSQGLGKSTVALLKPQDILIWIDLIIIVALLLLGKIKIDQRSYGISSAFAASSAACFMLVLNMFLAETSRPRLLVNTFDRSYVVKYLGLDTFTAYDMFKSARSNSVKKNANADELNQILSFTQQNYAKPSSTYFGKARGKNVIVIHLESFQQFLINLKINGQEVTPFLNSLYKSKHTLAFDNFYHQVGLGRTSDAENMLETGTFGLSDGSVFTSLGSENTFQAAPQILRQRGYTSAVFHGNTGTFWNRNEVYKNFGYNYFFDANYFSNEKNDKIGYGLKDKLLFSESIKYLEQMQQPFYVKYLTVTNHIPFDMDDDDKDPNFKTTSTSDQTVNNYFLTAHYLDQAVQEFFTYLHKSGLYKNSLIIIYGDHYGLSDSDNDALASVIGKSADDWTSYDSIKMQKVPYMIHMSGLKGGINHEVGGEIDALPTLLHLLGIKSQQYVNFGTDLLSPSHRKAVVFRNGTIVTQKYVITGSRSKRPSLYDASSGQPIAWKTLTAGQKKRLKKLIKFELNSLHFSDLLNNRNLLRFYTPAGFIPDQPTQFDYKTNYQQMEKIRKQAGSQSTSLYSQNGGSTTSDYQTDASELKNRRDEIDSVDLAKLQKLSPSTSKSKTSSK